MKTTASKMTIITKEVKIIKHTESKKITNGIIIAKVDHNNNNLYKTLNSL